MRLARRGPRKLGSDPELPLRAGAVLECTAGKSHPLRQAEEAHSGSDQVGRRDPPVERVAYHDRKALARPTAHADGGRGPWRVLDRVRDRLLHHPVRRPAQPRRQLAPAGTSRSSSTGCPAARASATSGSRSASLGAAPDGGASSRRTPTTIRSSSRASCADRRISRAASCTSSGASPRCTSNPPACRATSDTRWATTSCISRAIRDRSGCGSAPRAAVAPSPRARRAPPATGTSVAGPGPAPGDRRGADRDVDGHGQGQGLFRNRSHRHQPGGDVQDGERERDGKRAAASDRVSANMLAAPAVAKTDAATAVPTAIATGARCRHHSAALHTAPTATSSTSLDPDGPSCSTPYTAEPSGERQQAHDDRDQGSGLPVQVDRTEPDMRVTLVRPAGRTSADRWTPGATFVSSPVRMGQFGGSARRSRSRNRRMTKTPRDEGKDMNQQQTVETPALSEIDRFGAWATRVLWPAAGTENSARRAGWPVCSPSSAA